MSNSNIYVLLDTETTGLGEEDKIIQIAIQVISDGYIKYSEDFCSSSIPISLDAMVIHGITTETIQDKPALGQTKTYNTLNTYNNTNNILIGHNISFDIKQLKKYDFVCKYRTIDTLKVVRNLFPELEKYTLQYLRYALGLYNKEELRVKAHDAASDVEVLRLLLVEITDKLISLNIEDPIQHMLDITKQVRFTFGKYKGRLASEVWLEDPGYAEWAAENAKYISYEVSEYIKKRQGQQKKKVNRKININNIPMLSDYFFF